MTIISSDTAGTQTALAQQQIAVTETISGRTCLVIGVLGIGLSLVTGEQLGAFALFEIGLTLVMLSGGLSITWSLAHATRAACRERRYEMGAAVYERRQQHAEIVGLLREIRDTQGLEAEVIGDVLAAQRRRNERG